MKRREMSPFEKGYRNYRLLLKLILIIPGKKRRETIKYVDAVFEGAVKLGWRDTDIPFHELMRYLLAARQGSAEAAYEFFMERLGEVDRDL